MGVCEVTAATTQPCEIEAKHAEPGLDQRTRGLGGGDVAADHIDLGIQALDFANAVDHALAGKVFG